MTIFAIFGLGFAIQRFHPFDEGSLSQLSWLEVQVLLPAFLFFTTATQLDLKAMAMAPLMVLLGIVITIGNFFLGWLAQRPLRVDQAQRSAFRFSMMWMNTLFLGAPICGMLFGAKGLVYAALFDFGATLVNFILGVWVLRDGKTLSWRVVAFNPLLLSVAIGLTWAYTRLSFPGILTRPFELLGSITLPLALLVGGMMIGSMRAIAPAPGRPLVGLALLRLLFAPLLVAIVFVWSGLKGAFVSTVVIETAMPVGLVAPLLVRTYGGDFRFTAAATFYTTLAAVVTAPLITVIVTKWF